MIVCWDFIKDYIKFGYNFLNFWKIMLENVVVIYLGGMDFFIVLYKVLKVGKKVYVLSFNYG